MGFFISYNTDSNLLTNKRKKNLPKISQAPQTIKFSIFLIERNELKKEDWMYISSLDCFVGSVLRLPFSLVTSGSGSKMANKKYNQLLSRRWPYLADCHIPAVLRWLTYKYVLNWSCLIRSNVVAKCNVQNK